MVKKIISAVGTFASIVSLGFIKEISWLLRMVIVVVGSICLCYLIYDAIKNSQKNEIECHSNEEVAVAMKRLIKSQGKICIMSRDLSWVNTEIAACIIERKENILIFAEKENKLTKNLEKEGVYIRYYGHLNFEPKTRFTIIHYNSNSPQVAIANTRDSVRKKSKFKHIIYETDENGGQKDKMINSLALDMMSLCNEVSKGAADAKTSTSKKSR